MKNIIIAVDAMGGDHAPQSVIEGVSISAIRHPNATFIFYGQESRIRPLIEEKSVLKNRFEIIHTEDIIAMEEKPSVAIRSGKNSSMCLAIEAVRDGKAHGIISGGNTGALMALAKLRLRMINGIERPAIASLWPTVNGECVVTDLGANIEASYEDLVDYAIMGSEYAKIVFDKKLPKVGLLNIGTEDVKGNERIKQAASILSSQQENLNITYHGFVEGNDICAGTVDVVVTDGFTGNIALKTAEGTAKLISTYLKGALQSTLMSKVGAFLAQKALYAFKDKVDPRRVNGGVFLGLNGIAVKSHGGADGIAFASALDLTIDLANGNIIEAIKAQVSEHVKSNTKIINDNVKASS